MHEARVEQLVDGERSIEQGAVYGWDPIIIPRYSGALRAAGAHYGFVFDPALPVKELGPVQRDLLFHGVALGLLHAQSAAGASRSAVTATSSQPGVPLPEHDETTCAVCHASVTLTALTLAREVLPDAPATVQRAPALAEERLPRAPAARPTSSRAPPALRSA